MSKNMLYYGDNLEVMRKYIKDNTIDLCYIDPPFNSKRNYNQIYNAIGNEDKAQAQAFIDTWTWDDDAIKGFEQILTNYNGNFTKQSIELIIGLEKVLGKDSLLAYLVSMTLRIVEIFRVLKPTGSFYFHCDPTASHYLKLVLDAVFCSQGGNYQNEIIWSYRRWTGEAKRFLRMHDIIFFYTKSEQHNFNAQFTAYTDKSLARKQNYHTRIKGDDVYVTSIDERGVKENDVWVIPVINSQAKERLGYPTQKPEGLLERIIQASSNIGDVILDAYCGCGTSVAVAERLNRTWIGIDITYQSISLILKRMEDTFGKDVLNNITLNGIPEDFKSAVALANKKDDKTRKEFEKWAVLTYSNNKAIINEKKGADAGIDGIAYMTDRNDNSDIVMKQVLFSVKSDKNPHVSYIRDLNGVIERDSATMGYFITLYPPTKPMIDECKKLGKYKNTLMDTEYPKIEIVTVEDILDGKRITIPTSHQIEVVKSAKKKALDQEPLF